MTVYSKIIGTGSYLPARRVTNDDLAAELAAKGIETSDEWIVSRSGISARHYAAADQKSSDLAVEAAKRALEMAGKTPLDVDMVIVASSTPDFQGSFPSTACIVQQKLGMTNHSAAFDVQAVCSGFVYAVSTADAFIKSGMHKTVLVIGAEVFSRILNFEDRTTCVLFGDGAGAVVMTASNEPGILASKLHADGTHADILSIPPNPAGSAASGGFLHMDGQAVFKLAVTVLEEVATEVLDAAQMKASDVDWLIPHQANIRIMKSTAKKLGLPLERMVVTVDEHGNTSAASIPLALDLAVRDGRIKAGDNILMEGVGGGFTWGAILARM
ncbi:MULTISPECIES: beta-ketoacyl-ACP synthase III [unclassified Massilia]|uniref:beta-ketoacyl-ACP synthase III n=1 Tax=unclassified Massilia TaxID=2609279 RepID=UPI00177F3A25|nr:MULTISPECIES: beta-ketoacyl-ACP synthase III [unclassified Massilia]MBD8530489.1 ketoacyl-ACP synthase III [Massilia sp. CFBP 13647]MBD8674213.1 ketoacyl-ACP synthase III [Massilia sp. CFBP 13721]